MSTKATPAARPRAEARTGTGTATRTTLHLTHEQGQSIWYDNIRRGLIASGELQTLISQGILGITSNPTIFEKAISASNDYDDAFRELVGAGCSAAEIYEALAVDDIRAACDLLRPVYDASGGVDGRVSLEVLPELASNTEKTVSEGVRLARLVGRPNVMIKVPATPEGLPAIRALTAAGVSVNVTLIFGLDQYREVWDAYVEGLEDRVARGESLDGLVSVASFFVSRVDSSCDKLLDEKAQAGSDGDRQAAEKLRGKIAIANAKLAYEMYEKAIAGEKWKALAAGGAKPQRLLWASTGTKDKRYSDTMYLDGLIGPDTVNTVPPATLSAFIDHGKPGATLKVGVEEARAAIAELGALGIDLGRVCRGLLADGVKAFSTSMTELLAVIDARRAAVAEKTSGRQTAAVPSAPSGDRAAIDAALHRLATDEAPRRLWNTDATLFSSHPDHEKSIRNRLGWLHSPEAMCAKVAELEAFAAEVRAAGFKRAVLLGMGGSSLCPEVLSLTGGREGHGGLPLDVLDNTDPDAVRTVDRGGDPAETLFIVASKSGGTIEIQAFERYFWSRVLALYDGDIARTGAHFVAITDPATRLGQLAEEKKYRRVFINRADIGGRYSALSYFGLVPAALLGLDVAALVGSGAEMARASSRFVPVDEIVGLELGAIMGALATRGKDKLTLVSDPEVESLGSWIEQLVAESTGKEGKGIIPVDLEPLGPADIYGDDRLFVYTSFGPERADRRATVESLAALESAGHPVVRLRMANRSDLGREFFRWELATAIAGSVLRVNPFDEPDVTEAKLATSALLALHQQQGKLPDAGEVLTPADGDAIRRHVSSGDRGHYFVFSSYFRRTPERDRLLTRARVLLRQKTKLATTHGYGPRYLHSTGQLHKGGPATGIFIQLTGDVKEDLPIPAEAGDATPAYSFGTLRNAQALGDLQVLRRKNRRVIRVHLGADIEGGLEQLVAVLAQAS